MLTGGLLACLEMRSDRMEVKGAVAGVVVVAGTRTDLVGSILAGTLAGTLAGILVDILVDKRTVPVSWGPCFQTAGARSNRLL